MKRLIPGYIAGLVLAVSLSASASALALGLNPAFPEPSIGPIIHNPVRSPDELTAQIARHRPRDRAHVTILRGADRRTLAVILAKRPETPVSG